MLDSRFFLNTHAAPMPDLAGAGSDPLPFHQLLPGYTPTPLVEAPNLAQSLRVGKIWVKDESERLGLPAFKILGASWAVARALARRLGQAELRGGSFADLVEQVAPLRPLTLTAATDGNHGRAVARMAALFGLEAHIFVPADMAPARVQAIAGEGAQVTVVDGTYDEAVARSAELAGPRCLVISDTSWPGYEDTPRDVIAGYATIFHEIDAELARRAEPGPDIVFVQIGVGALATAVIRHYLGNDHRPLPALSGAEGTADHPHNVDQSSLRDNQSSVVGRRLSIVGVEPDRAACVLASLQAGRIVAIPGPHDSIMSGLNCGTPSLVAWPALSAGLDLLVAIGDERAREGMRALARDGVVAGETGAAGAGGLIDLCRAPDAAPAHAAIGLGPNSRVLLLCTEGATDPVAYRQVVGAQSMV